MDHQPKEGILGGSADHPDSASLDSISAGNVVAPVPIDEAQLVRRIDFRVLPILFIVYVVSILDRVNISYALTLGLPDELGLKGSQPNVALTVFFIPFIIFEIPSNLLLKRLKPRFWLSSCVFVFGVVTIGQGFVQNYHSLLATRFLLGLAEAGIFPGSFYLISFWYKQEEAQKRFTVYWSSTIVAGGFGGLLTSAIANLGGVQGLSSWRWVFILEGIATILVAVAALFFVSDFPREANWLSENEREFLLKKTESEEPHTVPITTVDIKSFLSKPTNWLGALMYFSLLVSVYSVVYFVPSIVKDLGYSTIQTQLHSVPPFAAALGFTIISAYLSDKFQLRSPFIFPALSLLITGLAILRTVHGTEHFSAEYAAIILTTIGSVGIGGHVVCWYLMNLRGHAERSIGSAWMICFGGFGGIVATFAFLKQDSPYYRTGYSINLATASLCVVVHACYGLLIWRQRKAMNHGDEKSGYVLYM
ncbi:major facilitator superfamily domain-containing protein [Xylaria bambusicola]|uniref:major facilitator superfamily domain-containing protein n=1 Tax=Xylaria bambusicola TaxID=326684 RepID=UPI0020072DA2|nr:major facilitator superfamily domain-containing protein [Xylaria bambusicola]KAI0517533.1 major facilitator superfamily domain-containing protein [Xylaria bambusicola]